MLGLYMILNKLGIYAKNDFCCAIRYIRSKITLLFDEHFSQATITTMPSEYIMHHVAHRATIMISNLSTLSMVSKS